MNCCQCQGIEDLFNQKMVAEELEQYRKKGPNKTTVWLIDALKKAGVQGLSLLDIGGGVGAIQHALLGAGVQTAVDVDASQSYINAARQEAQRRGMADRLSFQHGNFIDLAAQIHPADIVTLDRVICCYPDMTRLVALSVERANRLYGVVYPRDTWLVRWGAGVSNIFFRLWKRKFRIFAHPSQTVDAMVRSHGFKPCFYRQTLIWQVVLYSR